MSKQWGNAYWEMFHSVSYKLNNNNKVKELLEIFIKLCNLLPCPICKSHSNMYLSKINKNIIKTKENLVDLFFNFHNNVNKKNRKKEFTKEKYINKYSKINLITVLNNFVVNFMKYKEIGKLDTDYLQKQLFINNFINFIKSNRHIFNYN